MKPTEINADLENHLIKIVKEYAIKMNEIENQISDLQDKDTEGKIDCFAVNSKSYTIRFSNNMQQIKKEVL